MMAKSFTEKRYFSNVFDLMMAGGASEGGVPRAPMEVALEIRHEM
jgi:hypothetical protein